MMVISAYNNHANSPDGFNGYISGACGPGLPNTCPYYGPPSSPSQYVHDFGSILNFIEYAFGTNGNFLSYGGPCGIGPCSWPYADYEAPDGPNCGQLQCPAYSLSDFFTGNWTSPAPFVPITSFAYPQSTFVNWGYQDGNVPTNPDTDENGPQ